MTTSPYLAVFHWNGSAWSGGAISAVLTQADVASYPGLTVRGECVTGVDVFLPVPSFDVTTTFRWTHVPPLVTFQ